MRITTESHATGGLAILPEVPDMPAVLIEGRNGIGKTILVHLLELVSGKQPYAEHGSSWRSLRDRLGPTRLTLSGLDDEDELTVRFTPDRWPTDEVPLVIGSWLGDILLNGEPVETEVAQDLLWIERFAGNEDLGTTLRRRLDIYSDRVDRTHRGVSTTIASINETIGPLAEQLRPLDPERLIAQRAELATADKAEREAREELESAVGRHNRVLAAIENARRVQAADDPAAALAARRTELQEQVAAATTERDEVQARVEDTAERLTREGNAQGALADAQRIQRYRAKRLRNLVSTAAAEARRVNVEQDRGSLDQLKNETRAQLAELRRQRAALDAGGQTARLIDRLDGILVSADTEGLDDQELAIVNDQRYSVRDIHDGMRARAEELRGRPLPEELRSVDSAINEAQRRLTRLNTLARTLQDEERQEELLAEADKEVEAAIHRAETAGALDEAFREDSKRLGQLEEQIDKLGVELADLYEQMGLVGGRSIDDARSDLQTELRSLGIEQADALPEEEHAARLRVEGATDAVKRAGEAAASLRRSVTVVHAAIEGVINTLRANPMWSWMAPDAGAGTGDTHALDRFAVGRNRLLGLEQRLDGADRLLESFRTVANVAMTPDDPLIGRSPRVAALRRVLGHELRAFLDTPSIRAALFDGAEVVDVNPVEAHVTLESHGAHSIRPFDSFSTGEQAFAFTQARIRELVASEERNRLLVLDEFGAFVAADRLPSLVEFLNEDALGAICDQVVVVFPLQVDYEADLDFTTGALADRYRDRAAQIAERGYCAVPLSA